MQENTHNQVFEQIEQSGAVIIELFYIAAQVESNRFREFIEETIDYFKLEQTFGFSIDEEADADELISLLFHKRKIGFVCEIGIPQRSDFRFSEDGELQGCSVRQGSQTLYWVYGENLEELFGKVEQISDEHQEREIQEWKMNHA